MAIFRGVGGSGDSSDNSFLQEVTAQAQAAEASATSAANSATSALNTELTSASFNTSDGVLTLTKQDGDTVTADLDGRFLTSHFTGDISFGDNAKAKFGDGGDLLIYHSTTTGHKSIIEDAGAGGLDLITNGSSIRFRTNTGDTMLTATKDSGIYLNHNNFVKLQTTVDGITVWDDAQFDTNINVDGNITVSGTVDGVNIAARDNLLSSVRTTANNALPTEGGQMTGDVLFNDGVKAKFGTDSDLAIYHTDGGNSIIEETGEGALVLKTNGSAFAVLSDDNEYMINATVDGGVNLYNDGTLRLSVGSTLVSTSAGADFRVGSNSFFVDESDDKVGINTLTPSETLDVDGNIKASGTLATGGYTLSSTDGTNGQVLVTNGSGNVSFGDVTVDVSGKANLSGDTFTGDVRLSDDVELKLGDGANGDLRIFHTSSNGASTIREQGSSNFYIQGDDLHLTDTSGNKYFLGVSGSFAKIYYNGDEKLNTRSDGIGVTGDLTISGTVDGRDVATDGAKLDNIEASADVTDTANVTSAGAAMLASSPTFTGTITAPNLDITHTGYADVTTNIATGGGISGNTKVLNLGTGYGFGGDTTVNIGSSTAFSTNTINLNGDVVVGGTLNGGAYERTVRTRFQRRGYSSVSPLTYLSTTYNQVGSSLRINSGVTTAVENVLDLNITLQFSDINSSNEGLLAVTVDAPNPSNETTVNLGTVTATSQGIFKVTGDFTKHFSPYCGMSTNSDGSNSFTFTNYEGWSYDPVNDETSVFYNPFQSNTPSLGDTVYLHPFDWETQGTEIYGEIQPIEAYNASGTVHQNQFHQIYLGYYKPERTFKIKAKETTASENIAVTRLAGSYSQIIGG